MLFHFIFLRTFFLVMTHVMYISVDLILVGLQLGKVLRAKKILIGKAQAAPNCEVFSSYEQLVWGKIPELIESVKQDRLPQAYAELMSQHLGANHVDGGVRFIFNLLMFLIAIFLLQTFEKLGYMNN
jgi:hypothetical protein